MQTPMPTLVTITSQGQMTIPAKFRRKLGLDESKKAVVAIEDNKLIVEPIPELLSLEGSLQHKAKKGKKIEEIIKEEEEAIADAITEDFQNDEEVFS